MVEIIKGFIVDATAPKFFVKKDGTTAQRVTLHIKAVTNDPYPKEIAVNCAGDLCNWATFAGSFTVVECEYVNRVFPFEKNGEKMLGNDVYARSIKIAPTQPAAPPAPPVAFPKRIFNHYFRYRPSLTLTSNITSLFSFSLIGTLL